MKLKNKKLMMVHGRETKKKNLPESDFPVESLSTSSVPKTPPPASGKVRELAMMNIMIVTLEEVKFLRKKIGDLEDNQRRIDARNRKQGKSDQRLRHSPLHISRQRSFCTPSHRNNKKRRIAIQFVPRHEISLLPIRKRKINLVFSASQ